MKNILIVIVCVILLFSCNEIVNGTKNTHNTQSKPELKNNHVAFVVNNYLGIPVQIRKIKSLNNFSDFQSFSNKEKDTVILNNISGLELITISHKNMQLDTLLIFQGDTLKLEFNKGKKYIKTKYKTNTSLSEFKENSYEWNQNTTKHHIDSLTSLFYEIDYSKPMEINGEFDKLIIYPYLINKENLKTRKKDFKKLIDLNILQYQQKIEEIKSTKQYDKIQEALSRQKLYNSLYNLYDISNEENILSLLTSDIFINDSTQFDPLGYNYLYNAIYNIYFKDLQNNSRSKISYNQVQIFDSIPNYFNNTLIKYGRMICLQEMAEEGGSLDEIDSYFKKFNSEYKDTKFRNYFQTSYLTDLRNQYSSKSNLNLINNYGEVVNLKSVIENLKDKIIYIDFWASWCAPCRETMPASKELRLEYENKDVIFLFISIDKNSRAWRNASLSEGFEGFEYNYLLINENTSSFIKDLKINTIPRYLLYNRNGNLVHQNAPGPEGQEIRKLLDKYLIK